MFTFAEKNNARGGTRIVDLCYQGAVCWLLERGMCFACTVNWLERKCWPRRNTPGGKMRVSGGGWLRTTSTTGSRKTPWRPDLNIWQGVGNCTSCGKHGPSQSSQKHGQSITVHNPLSTCFFGVCVILQGRRDPSFWRDSSKCA